MTMLRDLLHMELSPLANNVAASQIMVLYFKIAQEVVIWFRIRSGVPTHSKQQLHILLSTLVIFWPLFDTSDWSWRLNALVPAVMMARFVYKVREEMRGFQDEYCMDQYKLIPIFSFL